MTDDETPKTDFLKWWLVFLTMLSVFLWLGTVIQLITFFSYYLNFPVVYLPFGASLILIPYLASSSWRNKQFGMNKQSTLDSLALLIMLSFTFIFNAGLIMAMVHIENIGM
jgi:hypothetical protein